MGALRLSQLLLLSSRSPQPQRGDTAQDLNALIMLDCPSTALCFIRCLTCLLCAEGSQTASAQITHAQRFSGRKLQALPSHQNQSPQGAMRDAGQCRALRDTAEPWPPRRPSPHPLHRLEKRNMQWPCRPSVPSIQLGGSSATPSPRRRSLLLPLGPFSPLPGTGSFLILDPLPCFTSTLFPETPF